MITINFPTVQNICVNIEATYQGVAQPWGEKYDKSHFAVTIEANGEEYSTDYYCQYGKTCLDQSEAACVLQCVLMDAYSYDDSQDIDDFAREFGYSVEDGIQRIIDIYNGCKQAQEAMDRLGLMQHGGELSEAIDNEDYEAEGDDLY